MRFTEFPDYNGFRKKLMNMKEKNGGTENGRSWPVLADLGRSWPVLAGPGRSWPVLAGPPNFFFSKRRAPHPHEISIT